MKLTERDVEILRFVNECGFCITPQLERRFLIRNWRVYQLMQRLGKEGLVSQKKIFHGKPNAYYLTNKGAQFTELPVIEKINLSLYEHQLALNDVVIKLRELYKAATWISERQLKQDNFFLGIGVKGHVSDGVFILDENKQISIEVELTLKSRHRLENILKAYTAQQTFKEVWYFCSPQVISAISKLVIKRPFIKIISLKEFLE